MALKSQDIKNGTVIRVDGKLQVVVEFLHVKPGKGNTFMRMNQETFDQVTIDKKMITGGDFMKEGDIVDVLSDTSTDTILTAEMPDKTVLEITYCEPGVMGNTATNAMKPATVETGSTVRVPLFINTGEKIVVKTSTGEYVERAK